MTSEKISIGYVIESLGAGGAERQLVELVGRLDRETFAPRVLAYVNSLFFQKDLDALGVPVTAINRRGRWDPRPLLQIARWLRNGEVDVVHSYLPTANLYAVAARRLAGHGKVVVSQRNALAHEEGLAARCIPWTFRNADLIIANSRSAKREIHQAMGIEEDTVLFIPNGLDLDRFVPVDARARASIRKNMDWPENVLVVLTVASFKPQKDHDAILEALSKYRTPLSRCVFCWVGAQEPGSEFERLEARIRAEGLAKSVRILEPAHDIERLYQASDIVLLPSRWEGTPNVVLEALACGRPVIGTDVSDVADYIVPGETGWLVPPGDTDALGRALIEAATSGPSRLDMMGTSARGHVESLGIDTAFATRRHQQVYERLVSMERMGR